MIPEEILASFREAFGERIRDERTIERKVGTVEPRSVYDVWIEVDRETLHDAVEHLCRHFNPHLSVISGDDLGEKVAFNYHFATGWGERYGEATFTIRTFVPKDDFRVPTITDLLPGAQTSEREKIEFFGLTVDGIPDDRNLFLPEDMTIHPWRKDLEEETSKEVRRTVKWEGRDE
ncbi:MAG TPA: NADH-quinone oxidoreductase subunit C [Candidatus Acetothermia bacterium]|nr:NADH-quinone oxidoreductase subunit C [Candidatus Acetothermia bacterium]